jgi:beta-lactamase regulating signal transducer with metallopeptidase domain
MNLTALQHSAFLQSLGWAIANSLWQGVILWSIYLLVNIAYKNASSTFKTNSGTAALFLLFTWFIVTFCQKFYTLIGIPDDNISGNPSFTIHLTNSSAFLTWNKLIDGILKTLPYLSVAYLFLLVILALRLFNSYRHIYFIKNHGLHKAGVEWRLFAEKVANHIGITKKIAIWLSDHVDVPATIGFIKPVILIPLASMNQLSVAQLEAIILHELSHIKRNDYLLNLFISLIETVLFFNPFVVLLCKVIKKERENSCDDFVIQYQYDRHSYASALLSLEQSRVQHLRLALTATSGKKQLLYRIQRIMEENTRARSFNYGQKLMALILGTGIICSAAWLSPNKKDNNLSTNTTAKNKISEKVISTPKQEESLHPNNNPKTASITGVIKSKKQVPATNNTAFIENPDINSDDENDNAKDEVVPVASELNASAVMAPHSGTNGFMVNMDKLKPFSDAEPVLKKNKQFTLPQTLVNNIRVLRDVPVNFNVDKLKTEMENAGISLNWKNLEEDIKNNWEKIQWLTDDEEKQKKILDKIEKMAWQEIEKTSERKVRERLNEQKVSRRDLAKLNKNFALAYDTLVSSSLELAKRGTTVYNYIAPHQNEYNYYTPSVPVAPKINKRIQKQQTPQHFEYRYSIDTDTPCKDKKPKQGECPSKKLTIDYSNGTVYINGKKVSNDELEDLQEINLKSITVDPAKQRAEILIND